MEEPKFSNISTKPFIKVNEGLVAEVEKIYHTFLEHNIKEMREFLEPMWLHPKQIGFDKDTIYAYEDLRNEDKKLYCIDPFVISEYEGNFDLGKDILERGTFWHFVIHESKGRYYVKEGKHRMASIHKLLEMGEWPEDKKLFCLVCNKEKSVFDKKHKFQSPKRIMRFRWDIDSQKYEVKLINVEKPKKAMKIIGGSCGSFRNFFFQTKISIKPYEKVNNYEKYKYYWK